MDLLQQLTNERITLLETVHKSYFPNDIILSEDDAIKLMGAQQYFYAYGLFSTVHRYFIIFQDKNGKVKFRYDVQKDAVSFLRDNT